MPFIADAQQVDRSHEGRYFRLQKRAGNCATCVWLVAAGDGGGTVIDGMLSASADRAFKGRSRWGLGSRKNRPGMKNLRVFQQLAKRIRSCRCILFCSWVLLPSVAVAEQPPHNTPVQQQPCFSIRMHLNGKLVEGPQLIQLSTKGTESAVPLEQGCFKVPSALLAKEALDISFIVPGNRIRLYTIAVGFFAGAWDIDLADKKFGGEVSLPKHSHARNTCAVVFHVGDPETQLVQTGCRTTNR